MGLGALSPTRTSPRRMIFKQQISLLWIVLIALLSILFTVFAPVFTPVVWAETPDGQALFNANCSACHIGGNNVIISQKTLKKDALEEYNMNSLEAIQNQIINGKNAMPSFKGRLSDEEVSAIAQYVLQQMESGW
jgi:cytochrome c6